MAKSVLHSAQLPSFDPHTGQLDLASHHLVSTPLSYLDSFSENTTLFLDAPPARPYQQASEHLMDAPVGDEPARPRKRRRRAPPTESASPADFLLHRQKQERQTTTDRESNEHHARISPALEVAVEAVRSGWAADGGQEKGWLGDCGSRVEWVDKIETAVRTEVDLPALAARFTPLAAELSVLQVQDDTVVALNHLFNRIVHNASAASNATLHLQDPDNEADAGSVLLPPSSSFLLADFASWSSPSSGIASFGKAHGGWDVVLMDPPWPNASATRSSSYETFDPYDLWKFDVPGLLGDKPALVGVWLTNRVKFRRLVVDKLFPAWRIRGLVEWYWVKIASETGELVWPLEATHRRCYEGLVLGYYVPHKSKVALPTLPQNKVFLAAPSGHSRKPVIIDLLRPYLLTPPSSPPNILELFARTTLAGPRASSPATATANDSTSNRSGSEKRGTFLAVGNEAIKFNILHEPGPSTVKGWVKLKAGDLETEGRHSGEDPGPFAWQCDNGLQSSGFDNFDYTGAKGDLPGPTDSKCSQDPTTLDYFCGWKNAADADGLGEMQDYTLNNQDEFNESCVPGFVCDSKTLLCIDPAPATGTTDPPVALPSGTAWQASGAVSTSKVLQTSEQVTCMLSNAYLSCKAGVARAFSCCPYDSASCTAIDTTFKANCDMAGSGYYACAGTDSTSMNECCDAVFSAYFEPGPDPCATTDTTVMARYMRMRR
ncbi:hypothetical protein JCM10207_008490 [Rhodosporidiobolus poonsookiae]